MNKYVAVDLINQYFNREEWYTPDEKWWPEREIGTIVESIPPADVVSREVFNAYIDLYSDILDSAVNIINFLRECIAEMNKREN